MSCRWDDPEIGFSKAQLNRLDVFRAWLRTSKTKLARELADPPDKFTVKKTTASGRREMRRLEKALILDRSSTSAAHIDSQILLKFVAYQNKYGAKLPIPHISTLFTLPSNPFSSDVVSALKRIHNWKKVEHKWIEDSGSIPSEFPSNCGTRCIVRGRLLRSRLRKMLTARTVVSTPLSSDGCGWPFNHRCQGHKAVREEAFVAAGSAIP